MFNQIEKKNLLQHYNFFIFSLFPRDIDFRIELPFLKFLNNFISICDTTKQCISFPVQMLSPPTTKLHNDLHKLSLMHYAFKASLHPILSR
jgi:hypothetical protein